MKIKDLIIDPWKEDIAQETVTDIKAKIKDISLAIKQILDHIANGRQDEFSTRMLVAFTYDLQLLIIKEMFHSAGIGDKTLVFQRFAYAGSYPDELNDLLDSCFQQLSNISGNEERLNKTFSKIRKDFNTYLIDYSEMWGLNLT